MGAALCDLEDNDRLMLLAVYLAARVKLSMDASIWSSGRGQKRKQSASAQVSKPCRQYVSQRAMFLQLYRQVPQGCDGNADMLSVQACCMQCLSN